MTLRVAAGLLWIFLGHAAFAQDVPAAPSWTAGILGSYEGAVRNAGRMECHRTVFRLQDGRLQGHYWIDDPDPFEGELSQFVPDTDGVGGSFVWTDKFGAGTEHLMFDPDAGTFHGAWGALAPDSHNPVWGVRGRIAACEHAVS